jgi:hypothetical protein
MENQRLLISIFVLVSGLAACQDRTVVQGTDISRPEVIGLMTPVALDAGPVPELFDSPASYQEFQVRTGSTAIPTVRPAEKPRPAAAGPGEDKGAQP